jgi:DNA topoisomerase-1
MKHLGIATDPAASARAAGLRYVSDATPGIVRRRAGKGFTYATATGRRLRDPATLRRIRALAIPPAWSDVWICSSATGHLQAVGRDARRRKQYRYHPRWRAVRDAMKYGRMIAFGEALPRIRARLDEHLALRGLARERVLASIVRLLDTTLVRVGNDEYARANGSYGLTTLRSRHAHVRGATVALRFRGKAGKAHDVAATDPRVAAVVRRARALPGPALFRYVNGDRRATEIDSAGVNAYIRHISRQDFTAKDFRTWAGTVLAAAALRGCPAFDSKAEARRNVVRAIADVAGRLGNTPAICRASYVHPAVIEAYLEQPRGAPAKDRAVPPLVRVRAGLRPEEAAVLALLRRRRPRGPGRAVPRAGRRAA